MVRAAVDMMLFAMLFCAAFSSGFIFMMIFVP